MTTEDFLNELCDVLGRDPNSLSMDDTPNTVKEWDSVGHLSMIATIDDVLEVSVDDEDLRTFNSIDELVTRLKARNALED
ncbi:acyl carrier protein [Novipirellula sp. SH528]|uniref:acyl carrier protein n=1 Tax=Novipirellula sp. SH528 TaxID=3454466 RepID=UPI003F9F309E